MSDEIERKIAQLIRSEQKGISPQIIKGLEEARNKALLAKRAADHTLKQSREKEKRHMKALILFGICFVAYYLLQ